MPATDLLKTSAAADKLLKQDLSSHRRRILQNYRRHVLLEVAGLWEQIFVPEMTVDHPVYRVNRTHQHAVLDGAAAVRQFYAAQAEGGGHITVIEDEDLAVGDWGIATEVTLNKYVPAREAAKKGHEIDDPSATYLIRSRTAMVWHYNDAALLTGEHLYEDATTLSIRKVGASEAISPEQALAVITPILNPAPPLRASRFEQAPRTGG
jgi:hypothetical protein